MLKLSAILMMAAVGCSAVVRQDDGDDGMCAADCDQPAASGGFGSGFGTGGTGGVILPVVEVECDDHPVPDLPPWQPTNAGPPDSPGELLVATQQAMAGDWHGVVTTPWVPPYEVLATFDADGSYSAHCVYNTDYDAGIDGCCRAFYYGTDRDNNGKKWELLDVSTSGAISGEIGIIFYYGDNSYQSPGWQGLLQHVEVDATGDRLRFEFRTSDGYGPVAFDLWRL